MPSIGLKVRRAMRSPSTQPIARSKPGLAPPASTSSTAMRIIWRGTGLMAGSPGGTRRPGWVTVPTPGAAMKRTSPAWLTETSAKIVAPSVLSGSSPAYLSTSARTAPLASGSMRAMGTSRQ